MCNNVHLCTFMYIFDLLHCSLNPLIFMCKNVHFENIGFTFLHIGITFLNIFILVQKKNIFSRGAKKMCFKGFARKTHFGTFYHTWFSLHISITFCWLPSALFRRLLFFSKKCFLMCIFSKMLSQCTKMLTQCIQMYIFAHFMHILYIRNNKFTTKTTKKQ